MMDKLNKTHIENLVTHFYQRVSQDELLGPIFNEVAHVDWDHHIPLICQFWNSIMLKTHEYRGNAYMKHILLAQQTLIEDKHFARWLALFEEEANKHLPAQSAIEIVQRASSIAESLKYGILSNQQ